MRSANPSAPLQGLRLYKALLGLIQASGLAGGFDFCAALISHARPSDTPGRCLQRSICAA